MVHVDGDGERTMYPDRAAAAELAGVPAAWLEGAAVLHAPSYCFAAEPAASSVLTLIKRAQQAGIPVSLDASSAGMIEEYGRGFLAARARGGSPVESAAAGHALARSVLLSPGATVARP